MTAILAGGEKKKKNLRSISYKNARYIKITWEKILIFLDMSF